jgi:hypothetical protein
MRSLVAIVTPRHAVLLHCSLFKLGPSLPAGTLLVEEKAVVLRWAVGADRGYLLMLTFGRITDQLCHFIREGNVSLSLPLLPCPSRVLHRLRNSPPRTHAHFFAFSAPVSCPLWLGYATTFNGWHGLILSRTVLDLRTDTFAHGQLYIRASSQTR